MLRNRSVVLGRAVAATRTRAVSVLERLEDRRLLAASTDILLSSLLLDENVALDTAVGTFSSVDDDVETFTYALVSGAGSADNLLFNVVGDQLRTNANIDFETKPLFNIRVRSTGLDGLSFEKELQISVNNLAEAPSDLVLSNATVVESAPAGQVIGVFSSIDQDNFNIGPFTYSLVAGTGDANNNLFEIVGGELRSKGLFDFETLPSASILVRSTDPAGEFREEAFTITVTNVDEVEFVLTNNAVPENYPADSLVGFFKSASARNFVSYALATGTGDTDNAQFTLTAAGELRAIASFDYDTKSTYSIRVAATDDYLPTARVETRVFTINVVNLNEAPSQITLTPVAFGTPAIGFVAGTFATVDQDAGQAFTYALVAGPGGADNALFQITGAELSFIGDPAVGQTSFNIRVSSTDPLGAFVEQTFIISPINLSLNAGTVLENTPAGTAAGQLQFTGGIGPVVLTYALTTDVAFPDNAAFLLSTDGLLTTTVSPNFEVKPSYTIQVQATNGSQTYLKTFTVSVANDLDLPTDVTLTPGTIAENTPLNSSAGVLGAVHADADDVITYALVAGAGDTDNALFTIDALTGQLQSLTALDFETQSTYSVRVEATDSTGNTFAKALTINVLDVAEFAPTDISLSADTIAENQPLGTTIGSFSVVDQDLVDSWTYTLVAGAGGSDNGSFSISPAGVLQAGGMFNAEVKSTFSIRVRATDSMGLFYEKPFTITVTSVNEAPSLVVPTNTLPESAPIGTEVPVTISDPDVGDVLTLSLVQNTLFPDNAAFEIIGNKLITKVAFNYETKSIYMVRLRVADAGGLSAFLTQQIRILNGNDAPQLTGLTNLELLPNTAAGRFIAELRVKEEDVGDRFTTVLVPGADDNDLFDLDYLRLTTKVALPADRGSFVVTIRVTDAGGLSSERSFTLTVVGFVGAAQEATAIDPAFEAPIDEETPTPEVVNDVVTVGDPEVETPVEEEMVATAATPLVINGGEGNDVIVLSKVGEQYVYTLNGNVHTVAVAEVSSIAINVLGGNDIVTILPGVIGVSISGGAGDDSIAGGEGNDFIQGGDGDDSMLGADGVDTIYGNFGEDLLLGGAKRDVIYGGLDDDEINGNEGPDSIYGGNGADAIRGALGSDYIEGRGKADSIIGGEGNDTIIGGAGADSILGSSGDDVLYASASELFGDTLDGGDGTDSYEADADDTLLNVETAIVL